MNKLRIPYESESFPHGTVQNGTAELSVTWDDILWAAVTVGRPNRYSVFRHGNASIYEALFRLSLTRMALEQHTPTDIYLQRTNAAKTLDPTEKGAVSYFLGMTFCKLFATKLLNTPWLLHLDVFRPELDPVLAERSRPDLVGEESWSRRWHAFECKGRVRPPDATAMGKAKSQARRLISVKGTPCSMHIGAIAYFRSDKLHFYWRDPVPEEGKIIELDLPSDPWRYYYEPVTEVVNNRDTEETRREDDDSGSDRRADNEDGDSGNDAHAPDEEGGDTASDVHIRVENYDLDLYIHHTIARYLISEDWEGAQRAAIEAAEILNADGFQPDGLLVRAGRSWYEKYREPSLDSSG